jgi:hypothetical protein
MNRNLLLTIAVLLLAAVASQAATYTYVDLIHRLTDLSYLATLPAPGDTCAQWSSYDRASKYDAATGKYLNWGANGDGGGYIRQEGEQFVFAEMTGPGCLWRIWSAAPGKGHVKIYLDGATEPTVDLPFSGYFDRKTEPFTYPTLVHITAANGANNYVPIPYAKSCRIVADKDWGAYYHFDYETFPAGTVVPTFKMALSDEERAALQKADGQLAAPVHEFSSQAASLKDLTVPAGGKVTVASLKDAGAITGLWIETPTFASDDTWRQLALQIRWDGETHPSVWSPLGDFFGTGPGLNLYQSFPLGITDKGLYSRWYMPFAKGAQIEILNDGAAERKLKLYLMTETLAPAVAAKLARFHAKWHRDAFLPEAPDRAPDWTILKTTGRGRYVGVALNVWNPRGGWWGEGDEKFFVDGEKFPSTIGTGSEDYFGYAWSSPKLFQNAYHNQTRNDNLANNGHVSVNRWQITDNIPFQTSFEGCIEKYNDNKRPTQYDCVAYWYQAPGEKDPYQPVPVADRVDYYTQLKIRNEAGALEGEALKTLAGGYNAQEMGGFGAGKWSGDMQLWWTPGKPDVKLVLALPVEQDGRYKLTTVLTKAIDYGIVQLYLDDQKLGDPIDLYNDGVIPTPVIDLGTHDLTKGEHRLTVEMIGKNGAAKPGYMFGMDWIKLEPVP